VDIALFWSLFVILAITYFAIAMGASRNLDSDDDFFYGQRSFGLMAMTLSLAAIQIGGGVVLATGDQAYRFGFYGIAYSLGICAGFLVLALGFAYKLKRLNMKTVVEIFTIKYRSLMLRRLASFLSILTLGGILVSQIIASRKLVDAVAGKYHWILVVFWLFVIVYTMFGGLRAVVATQIFQIVLVLVVFLGMLAIYVWKRPLSFDLFHEPFKHFTSSSTFEDVSFRHLWALFLLPLFYALLSQDLGQRFFSSKTPVTASLAALFAGVLVLGFSVIPVMLGMEARHLGIEVELGHSAILTLLKQRLEPFFYYLVICAIIAAISSTADAVLCAIGSNVVEDFLLASTDGPIDQHLSVLISRVVTLLIGLVALLIAYQFNDVLGMLSFSYELSVSCLLVPIVIGLFAKRPKLEAGAAAMIAGLIGFFCFRLYPLPLVPAELLSVILSLVGFLIGHFYRALQHQGNS